MLQNNQQNHGSHPFPLLAHPCRRTRSQRNAADLDKSSGKGKAASAAGILEEDCGKVREEHEKGLADARDGVRARACQAREPERGADDGLGGLCKSYGKDDHRGAESHAVGFYGRGRSLDVTFGDSSTVCSLPTFSNRLLKVRGKLYELITKCIPPDVIIKTLAFELLSMVDGKLKPEVMIQAAFYEQRLRAGSKAIFHLEAFVAKIMAIYKRYIIETFG